MTARDLNSTIIKKLTKRKKDTNKLYERRPEVELQILKILSLGKEQIFEFLKNRQLDSPEYLFDETIVYLLRNTETNNQVIEVIYSELNRRLWKLLRKFYRNFNNQADFEDFGQKTETAIIKKIFDATSDSADYAEVNFGDFAITQAKVIWRGELVNIKREKDIFYQENEETEKLSSNSIEKGFKSSEPLTDYTLMLKEGLHKLPPNIMIVAELLLDGWQIESKDDSEPTISKKLDVSSRTIRNWLKEARVVLADYNREVRR